MQMSVVYQPLPQNGLFTRILVLSPGRFNDPIHFTLNLVQLGHSEGLPRYEAISYACGDSSLKEQVHCPDGTLYTNRNLCIALRYLRFPNESRRLWADAICINENDVAERNYQVSNMPLVYRYATKVLAWLGEEADNSTDAMSLLRQISISRPSFDIQHFKPNVLMSELEHIDSLAARTAEPVWTSGAGRLKIAGVLASTHVGLLIQRPWFHRAWCVQEIAYSQDTDVICGRSVLSLDTFIRGLSLIRIGGVAEMNYQYWLSLGNAYFFRTYKTQESRLLEVLQCFRDRQASDPRDKVIALAALTTLSTTSVDAAPKISLPFPESNTDLIDYRLSVQTLYMKIAKRYLGNGITTSSLDYLSMPHQHTLKGLPSWVVDWSTTDSSIIPLPTRMSGTNHAATGDSQVFAELDDEKLILSGYMIDEVVAIAPAFPHLVSDWDVQQCFPAVNSTLLAILPRLFFLVAWWARKSATETHVACQWDAIAAKHTKEQYCQVLNACDFGNGKERDMFDSFRDWHRSRRISSLAFRMGLAYSSKLLYVFALIDHVLRLLHKQISGRTLPRYSFTTGRSLGSTRKGRLALVPGQAKIGDQIGLFQGAVRPFLARPTTNHEEWMFIGDAYIPGMMAGESFEQTQCKQVVFV